MKDNVSAFKSILSPLEGEVLRILWPDKKLRVREIHSRKKVRLL